MIDAHKMLYLIVFAARRIDGMFPSSRTLLSLKQHYDFYSILLFL